MSTLPYGILLLKKMSIVVLHGKGIVLLQNLYGWETPPLPLAAVLSPTAVVYFPDSIKASY